MQAATDQELDAFYGIETTKAQWDSEQITQQRAYDADDVQVAAYEHAPAILAALAAGDHTETGRILAVVRGVTIMRRCESALTGRITTSSYGVPA